MDCIENAFMSYALVFLYSRIVSEFNIVILKHILGLQYDFKLPPH